MTGNIYNLMDLSAQRLRQVAVMTTAERVKNSVNSMTLLFVSPFPLLEFRLVA